MMTGGIHNFMCYFTPGEHREIKHMLKHHLQKPILIYEKKQRGKKPTDFSV